MKTYTDIVLRSVASGDIAHVELFNPRNLTAQEAADLRRRIIDHGQYQRVPYFMIISQDRGFIWGPDDEPWNDAPPQFQFEMTDVIRHYFPDFDPDARLHESTLALVIEPWISDLIHRDSAATPDPDNALKRSGLLDELKSNGRAIEVLD